MRVALDTSALMMPVELDVRLFDELSRLLEDYTAVVPEAVVEELRQLAEAGRVDAVVTNDRPLRDRVMDASVPVIALRGTNKLDITRP